MQERVRGRNCSVVKPVLYLHALMIRQQGTQGQYQNMQSWLCYLELPDTVCKLASNMMLVCFTEQEVFMRVLLCVFDLSHM